MEKTLALSGLSSIWNLPWSTGSIFPIWEEMTKNNLVKSTGPNMTRYFYSVENACKLIDYVLENIKSFDSKVVIPDMKSAKIRDILDEWCKIYGTKWKRVNSRKGDKSFESILSSAEYSKIKINKTKLGNIFLIDTFSNNPKKDINSIRKNLQINKIQKLILKKFKIFMKIQNYIILAAGRGIRMMPVFKRYSQTND